MLEVTLDLDAFDGLAEKIAKRSIDLTPQLEVIGQDVMNAVQDAFKQGSFVPLAESTLKRKAKAGKSSQPLIYDGTWRRQHHTRVESNSVTVVTDVPYAVYHVSSAPRTKIPLRNPYDLGSSGPMGDTGVLKDCADRLAHYVATGEIT